MKNAITLAFPTARYLHTENNKNTKIGIVLLSIWLTLNAIPVQAAPLITINFSLSGFLDQLGNNGRIEGSFSGRDLNGDGEFTSRGTFGDELNIVGVEVVFSGNPVFDRIGRLSGFNSFGVGGSLFYEIDNNILSSFSVDFIEHETDSSYLNAITGNTYTDVQSRGRFSLSSDSAINSFGSDSYFVEGFDKKGNPLDNSNSPISLRFESNEPVKITVTQTPVPGALWLFLSALAGLNTFNRFKKPINLVELK